MIAALVAFIRAASFAFSALVVVSEVVEETEVSSTQAVSAMAASRMAACFNMLFPKFDGLRLVAMITLSITVTLKAFSISIILVCSFS